MPTRSTWTFVLANFAVWLAMTTILVVVPDALDRWLSSPISRVVGWALACSVWVVTVERGWQRRCGAVARFFVQLVLWVSAAMLAMWIHDLFQVDVTG